MIDRLLTTIVAGWLSICLLGIALVWLLGMAP